MRRSVTAEIDLEEAGEYSVLVKITAIRDHSSLPVETVIRDNCKNRRDKLLRIGLAYDLAHAKGQLEETAGEKLLREKAEARQKAKELAETRAKMIEEKKKIKKSLKKKAKREKAAAEKAAKKLAKRASKSSRKMVVDHNVDQNTTEKTQDNAAAAAEIARPGEPNNAKDQNSEECGDCKAQQSEQPAGTNNPQDSNEVENNRKDSSASNSNTSATRAQEDPAAHDVAGELSKNVTFGDPRNNHMPCGFLDRNHPSTCDIGGSNNATGHNSPSSTRSRRSSQRGDGEQQDSGVNCRRSSAGPPPGANSDTDAMSSTTILDFVQPTYRPGVHGRRRTSLVGVDRTIIREIPQAEEEEESDSDSDVSSVCSSAIEEAIVKANHPAAPDPPKTEEQKKKEEEEEDEFEKDPWNAVCVVGLRVYAKALVREERDGEVHWHKDEGCQRCGGEKEDVDKKVEELVKEIEAKDVWTPAPEDEKELCESPKQIETDKNGEEIEGKEKASMKGKRRVTIKRDEEPVEVTIRVVRPHSWEDGEASLDVDDSAMDATKNGTEEGREGRQDSIMGIRGRLGSVIVQSKNA